MSAARALSSWIALLTLVAGVENAAAQARVYPAARADSVVDDYHGTKVEDPFRWLEASESPRTTEWVQAEGRLTVGVLSHLPARDAIRRRLSDLRNYRRTAVPWREAGRLFFEETPGPEPQPVLFTTDAPGGTPQVALDPQALSPDGSNAIHDFAVSPDGRWLSYSSSPGGADIGETHVRERNSGRERDVVRGSWSSVCWTADGGGFFYMRPPPAAPGQAASAARIAKQLLYHRLGEPQERDRLIHEWEDARWLYEMLSDDGRRAIVVAERGSESRMYLLDLGRAEKAELSDSLVSLLGDVTARHTPMGTVGDTLYAFTDLDAPRGRVIALDLRQGSGARPWTVVPETTDVLQGATVAGDRLAIHYLHDVRSRLALVTLDGRPDGEVALPGIGAVGWALNGRHSALELWYSFTSFLSPETVYRYDLGSGSSRPFRAPRVPFDPRPYETRQVFYTSKDGTRVPMFITARKGLRLDAANPTFLTAYGGYGITTTPAYRPAIPLWLEMGGVYAVANIRGGGEYGEGWHRGGSLEHKQNSFDDFIAAAEFLIDRKYTAAGRLAIYGHSNGGLLVGAVMTQRPELFAVALANAGHHDMLRYQKFTVGAGWIPEYGTSDSASDFQVLRAYSPYHNVHRGTCYPATILLTGDHDDRVVPSHSYKFAAALQAAQGCGRPVLLRVASDASHGYASASGELAELTDVWSFVASRLGVKVSAATSRAR